MKLKKSKNKDTRHEKRRKKKRQLRRRKRQRRRQRTLGYLSWPARVRTRARGANCNDGTAAHVTGCASSRSAHGTSPTSRPVDKRTVPELSEQKDGQQLAPRRDEAEERGMRGAHVGAYQRRRRTNGSLACCRGMDSKNQGDLANGRLEIWVPMPGRPSPFTSTSPASWKQTRATAGSWSVCSPCSRCKRQVSRFGTKNERRPVRPTN